ncbi:hypothetical protein HDV05_001090 [Chytridiales sp. JEL 0842]|nr:hypothetical protein HDV05_001090 [Chytridiales sp. JEL 0842]
MKALSAEFPSVKVELTPKHRGQSFEVSVVKNGKTTNVWTGIEKTPRAAKFPDHADVVAAVKKLV